MKEIYTDYFQKSKVFLYPLLNVKNGIIKVPIQTYIAWDSVYTPEDNKFLCEYKTKKTNEFEKFIGNKKPNFKENLYHLAIGNGYHKMDVYKQNLNYIERLLFDKNDSVNEFKSGLSN